MGMRNEIINVGFVMREKRVDVGLIEEACALSLGKDKVRKKNKSDIGVKWKPGFRKGTAQRGILEC